MAKGKGARINRRARNIRIRNASDPNKIGRAMQFRKDLETLSDNETRLEESRKLLGL